MMSNKKLLKNENSYTGSLNKECVCDIHSLESEKSKLIHRNLKLNEEIVALQTLLKNSYENCEENFKLVIGVLKTALSELIVILTSEKDDNEIKIREEKLSEFQINSTTSSNFFADLEIALEVVKIGIQKKATNRLD